MTTHRLQSIAETAAEIAAGKVLLVAGAEAALAQLPAGRWIGGTTANVVGPQGGQTLAPGSLLVSDVTPLAAGAEVRSYAVEDLASLAGHYPAHGFSVIIVPGLSHIHGEFAKNAPSYEGLFNAPLFGWISGVAPADIGRVEPKVFAGEGAALGERVAVLHVALPPQKLARLDILNLFEPGDGAAFTFAEDGFETAEDCRIDGAPGNLAAYIEANRIDTKLPLVADYNGAMINVSIREVEAASGRITFYAPVFAGVSYRFARPVGEYVGEFDKRIADVKAGHVELSCNCILNYLYAGLEGKRTGDLVGPVTFGEIAYMLLNQTLVYATVEDMPQAA